MSAFFKEKNDFGKLMILIGILTLVPIVVVPFYYNEWEYLIAFIIPSISSIVLGFAVCLFVKQKNNGGGMRYDLKRGSLTVLFAWVYAIFIGAMPFLFLKDFNFIQCLFESASGWTTTGATLLNPEKIPHIFIFHCSFMQFCGGLGFILMIVMIVQNKQVKSLYNFEGHTDRLSPSLLKTSRTFFLLYFGIFVVGTILYICCGMPVFDSVIHAMSALATGGFSAKAGGIGAYNSVLIEIVTIIIMLLGMTNFSVLLLLIKRKFKQAARVSEVKFTGIVFTVAISLIIICLCVGMSLSFGESVRRSIFNVVSIISTTGFTTISFKNIPASAMLIFVMLMFFGGAAGSTSGGMKLNRIYLLFRGIGINVRKKISPDNLVDARYYTTTQGKAEIDNALLRDTFSYALLYFGYFFVTAFLLCLTSDASFSVALFESASLSSTVGISIGIFNSAANIPTLIIGIFSMIVARLEINIIIIGICSLFLSGKSGQKAKKA